MAFEEVDVIESVPAAEKSGITAGLVKLRSAPAKLRLTVRASVFAELGFTMDDRFVLLMGKDDDHGIIRLRKDKSGKIKPSERNFTGGVQAVQLGLGVRAEFVDQAHKASPCQFEKIDLTTVEIVLPPWADLTRQGKAARIAAKPAALIAAENEQARKEQEEAEARERRRQAELTEVAEEAARQTRQALRGKHREFRETLRLTATETGVLDVLVANAGRLVSKENIHQLVWGMADEMPDIKIVDVIICKIRPKLPISVSLKTIHGQGYKLTGSTADLLEGVAA
jgi:DNA-binding winged helix-turn-helix (wHTH) protein